MLEIKEEGRFRYCEEGEGPVVLLLHGLFGALSNFTELIDFFKKDYKVSIPLLPLYTLEVPETNLEGMVAYVQEFVAHKGYEKVNIVGNSLGGHVGLVYAFNNLDKVSTLTLTGSSGLFENSLGDSYPRKSDYEYIRKKTETTFYDPAVATKELVDEVYEITNNRTKAIRIVVMAKSAMRHNVREELSKLNMPVLLIWGAADIITPPFVGEEFKKLIADSELHILEKCGHAPMMELPQDFNRILADFLKRRLG
jgi:2-hydroxy-6-oxonona-2,4-dienedioate hydrolase